MTGLLSREQYIFFFVTGLAIGNTFSGVLYGRVGGQGKWLVNPLVQRVQKNINDFFWFNL